MSEIRKPKRLRQRQLLNHPTCVYCGGAKATQLDHVPPKAIFSLKLRPQGLEFSTCEPCHKGTRNIDAVAALTARAWPNLRSDEEREELGRLMGGVLRNTPPVRDELAREFSSQRNVSSVVADAFGSEAIATDFTVRRAVIDAFAARVGLALYFEFTGQVLADKGGVWVKTYTNVEKIEGAALPPSLDEVLGPTLALVQKGLKAEDDFQYAVRTIDDYDALLVFCVYRQSFANLMIVYSDAKDFPPDIQDDIFRPGFLIGYPL